MKPDALGRIYLMISNYQMDKISEPNEISLCMQMFSKYNQRFAEAETKITFAMWCIYTYKETKNEEEDTAPNQN